IAGAVAEKDLAGEDARPLNLRRLAVAGGEPQYLPAVAAGEPQIALAVLRGAEGDAAAVVGDGALRHRHRRGLLDAKMNAVPVDTLARVRPGGKRLLQAQHEGAVGALQALADERQLVASAAPGDAGVVGGEAGDVARRVLGGGAGRGDDVQL